MNNRSVLSNSLQILYSANLRTIIQKVVHKMSTTKCLPMIVALHRKFIFVNSFMAQNLPSLFLALN